MFRLSLASVFLLLTPSALRAQTADEAARSTLNRTRLMVAEVIAASYPELRGGVVRVKLLESEADYFHARFSLPHFLAGRRMRFLLKVNPRVFTLDAPAAGVRAIIAHELGHLLWYKQGNRLRLLGLMRLSSRRFTARFERWADLQAVSRGYGDGLAEYRRWLYRSVPPAKLAEKRRNYYSPAEIAELQTALAARPELITNWLKNVPLSVPAKPTPR